MSMFSPSEWNQPTDRGVLRAFISAAFYLRRGTASSRQNIHYYLFQHIIGGINWDLAVLCVAASEPHSPVRFSSEFKHFLFTWRKLVPRLEFLIFDHRPVVHGDRVIETGSSNFCQQYANNRFSGNLVVWDNLEFHALFDIVMKGAYLFVRSLLPRYMQRLFGIRVLSNSALFALLVNFNIRSLTFRGSLLLCSLTRCACYWFQYRSATAGICCTVFDAWIAVSSLIMPLTTANLLLLSVTCSSMDTLSWLNANSYCSEDGHQHRFSLKYLFCKIRVHVLILGVIRKKINLG